MHITNVLQYTYHKRVGINPRTTHVVKIKRRGGGEEGCSRLTDSTQFKNISFWHYKLKHLGRLVIFQMLPVTHRYQEKEVHINPLHQVLVSLVHSFLYPISACNIEKLGKGGWV